MIGGEKMNNLYFIATSLVLVVVLGLCSLYIPSTVINDDCNYDNKIGFLNGTENGLSLIIDNKSWYVSDYYFPDRGMPSDFSKYFGHNVDIRYAWGCGRVMILDVKIIGE